MWCHEHFPPHKLIRFPRHPGINFHQTHQTQAIRRLTRRRPCVQVTRVSCFISRKKKEEGIVPIAWPCHQPYALAISHHAKRSTLERWRNSGPTSLLLSTNPPTPSPATSSHFKKLFFFFLTVPEHIDLVLTGRLFCLPASLPACLQIDESRGSCPTGSWFINH